ncbi:EamA family transporter [Nocardiopsis coralliicola]
MAEQRDRARGLAFAVASALAFGGSGPAARPLLDAGVDPLHVTWLRVAGAALILAPLAVRHRRALRTHPALLLAYGVFPMAGVQGFYFAAIARIPVGVALLIEFLGPVLVLGWVRFVRRRRVPRSAAWGVLLALIGLAFLVEAWAGIRLDGPGLALALGAAACQAAYFLLSDAASADVDPMALVSYGCLTAALLLTPIAAPWTLPWPALAGSATLGGAELPAALLVVWLAAVTTALAYATGIAAIRRLSPTVAGPVAYLEVVTAIALAWLLLGEALTPVQSLGAAVIIAGAYLAQRAVPEKPDRHPEPAPT